MFLSYVIYVTVRQIIKLISGSITEFRLRRRLVMGSLLVCLCQCIARWCPSTEGLGLKSLHENTHYRETLRSGRATYQTLAQPSLGRLSRSRQRVWVLPAPVGSLDILSALECCGLYLDYSISTCRVDYGLLPSSRPEVYGILAVGRGRQCSYI